MIQYLVFIGALVNLFGCMAYVRDTLYGQTRPNRVTFFLWSLAPFIASAGGIVQGAGWGAFPVFMSGFCPFLIFVASFYNRQSVWKLGRFDWVCGALSLAALIFWGVTKNANVAIFLAILSDGAAALPTLKKCWTHPETEMAWPYLTGVFSASTAFFAIQSYAFHEIAFPIYLIVMCLSLYGMIEIGRRRKAALCAVVD